MNTSRRLCCLLLAAAALPVAAQGSLKLSDAWARPTVAGQSAGGGYVRITGGSVADRLLGGKSGAARSIELHEMTMSGTTMQMRAVDSIDVPAGGTVELKPGGLHVMFIGLAQPLKAGQRFPLTLRFEKAGELTVSVRVATSAPAAEHKH